MENQHPNPYHRNDIWTVIAIGVLAYIVQDFSHELLGHGVAARLFGAHPYRVSAIYLLYRPALEGAADRWTAAAGSMVNFLEALLCWAALRSPLSRNPCWRFFFWVSLVLNLFAEGSYVALCPFFGDWQAVTRGLEPLWLWRAACVIAGLLIDVFAAIVGLIELEPFLGGEEEARERLARALTLPVYLAGSAVGVLAVATMRDRGQWIGMAVGAFFGGSSLFAYLPNFVRKPGPRTPAEPLTVGRSIPWMVAAAIVALGFIFVVGPGLPLTW